MYNDQLQKRELVTQSLQKGKLHLNILATQRPAEGRSYWNKLLVTCLAQNTTSSDIREKRSAVLRVWWSNILRLRSFHRHQAARMSNESKLLRSGLAILLWAEVHQSAKAVQAAGGTWSDQPSRRKILDQISLEKTQEVSRWSMVSGSWQQRAQESSTCRLRLLRRWAVQHWSWRTNQMKNLHLGGARALQSSFAPLTAYWPRKKER